MPISDEDGGGQAPGNDLRLVHRLGLNGRHLIAALVGRFDPIGEFPNLRRGSGVKDDPILPRIDRLTARGQRISDDLETAGEKIEDRDVLMEVPVDAPEAEDDLAFLSEAGALERPARAVAVFPLHLDSLGEGLGGNLPIEARRNDLIEEEGRAASLLLETDRLRLARKGGLRRDAVSRDEGMQGAIGEPLRSRQSRFVSAVLGRERRIGLETENRVGGSVGGVGARDDRLGHSHQVVARQGGEPFGEVAGGERQILAFPTEVGIEVIAIFP